MEGGSEPLSVAMAGPPLVGEGVEVFLVGVDGGSDEPPLAADAGTPSVGEGEEGVLVGVEGDSEPPETVREVAAASERVQAAAAAEGPSADHGSWKDHLSGSDHSSGTDHLARNDAVHAEPAFLGGAAGDPAGSSRSPGGRAAAALDRMGEDLVCSVTQVGCDSEPSFLLENNSTANSSLLSTSHVFLGFRDVLHTCSIIYLCLLVYWL